MTYRALRLAAGALGLATLFAACDAARDVTSSTPVPPRLTIAVKGVDPVTRRVAFGAPVEVTVSASDDISLLAFQTIATRDTGAAKVAVADTAANVVFKSATPSFQVQFRVPVSGLRSGDTVKVRGLAMDGNRLSAADSIFFIVFDSIAPVVRLTAPTVRNVTMRTGVVTDSIKLTASDSSGLTSVSYEILSLVSGALVLRDSTMRPVSFRPTTTSQGFIADFDTLSPGSYLLRARATDATGLTATSDTLRFNIADAIPPVVTIVSPAAGAPLLVGDSIDIRSALRDNVALKRFTLVGFSVRGDPRVGATDTVILYDSVQFNYTSLVSVDSLDRRMRSNKVLTNAQDSIVWFRAVVTDISNNAHTAYLRQVLVSGPKVVVTADSSAWANKEITVKMTVMDSTPAIDRFGYRAVLSSNGQILKDTTIFVSGAQFVVSQTTFFVPATAPVGSRITITPRALDAGGQIGSGNTVFIPVIAEPRDNLPPTVYQTVPSRFEQGASLKVDAHDPSAIRLIGYEMRTLPDSVLIGSGTLARAVGSRRTNDTATFVVNYDRSHRGKKAMVISYAEDSLGNRGYSLRSGSTVGTSDPSLAKRDTALLVYGVTYALPAGSLGADIAVDTNATRKRVFISDVRNGGVFVWEDSSATRLARGFRPGKIAVGAFPWGMALDTSGNRLFVANSGGTNIDVVDLNTLSDLRGSRVQTPGTAVFDVAWAVNQTTQTLKYSGFRAITYSDRPQYIAQSANGNLYFSTRPTAAAPAGTLRRIDDPLRTPRMRQVWQYASPLAQKYTILNADSVQVYINTGPGSDGIRICDSNVNTRVPYCSATWVTAEEAMADPAIAANSTDVELVNNIDVNSLALPDTNFVASGIDGRRIAFAEGATGSRPGRVVTVLDTLGMSYSQALYSNSRQTGDLVNNASDQIFGIAWNRKSNYLAIHGVETYFADTALRLQGKVITRSSGAGIAFNPGNDSKNAADNVSQAFVASADSTIEIVDSYYFRLRQKLPLRANLYGALRVWYNFNPNAAVPLKVYGLTSEGLVVIDIRPEDLRQLP